MKNEIGNRHGRLNVIGYFCLSKREFIPECLGQISGLQKCAADDCNQIFPKLYYQQKYCSSRCRWRSQSRKKYEAREKEGVCPQCGQDMDPPATSSYCSRCQEYFHQRYMGKKRTKNQQKKDIPLSRLMGRRGGGRRTALDQEEGLTMREQLEQILKEFRELRHRMNRTEEKLKELTAGYGRIELVTADDGYDEFDTLKALLQRMMTMFDGLLDVDSNH